MVRHLFPSSPFLLFLLSFVFFVSFVVEAKVMLKNIINALAVAARNLFGNWRALSVFVLLYAALLLTLYWFFTTGVATVWQVVLTFALIVIVPLLFFLLQAMSVSYATGELNTGAWLKRALRDWWKLLLISLPLLLLAIGLSLLFDKGAVKLEDQAHQGGGAKIMLTAFNVLRFVVLYIALPLVAIQLWIAASREALGAALKGMGRSLVRALSLRSLLTYLIGFVIFAVIPYFLFFTRTPAKNAWLEMSLLGMRLVMALLIIFFGWVVTVGALARIDQDRTDSTQLQH